MNNGYKPLYASYIRGIFTANGIDLIPILLEPGTISFHVWRPRKARRMHPFNETVSRDPAILRYFNALKNRRRNQGYLSKASTQTVYGACTKFLLYLGQEITDHSISDLIKKKQCNPQDFTLEDKLLEFSNQEPLVSYRKYAVRILGVFRENRAKLQATVDYHFTTRTKKISDGILREIYLAQDTEKRALMQYQAFAGERIQCLSKLDVSQIEPFDDEFSVVRIKFYQNKVRIPHICIIPNNIADSILQICKNTRRRQPFPNYETLWKQITRYAMDKHGIRLTSHYLRKRFHSIAQKTAMPVNDWDFLMGDKMEIGHGASTYTLEDYSELVAEYKRYLTMPLNLASIDQQTNTSKETQTLLRVIDSLNQTITELRQRISALELERSASRINQ